MQQRDAINEFDRTISRGSSDPAADAAAMLLRLGFAIFALVIPTATLLSRSVIVILVPIGAILILLSALVRGDPSRLWVGVKTAFASPSGLMTGLFGIWVLMSLLWAPFPGEAVEKLFKALGVIVLAFLAVLALPMKMRASNLYLVTIGVGIGAILTLLAGLSDLFGIAALRPPSATPGRTAVLLTMLVWIGAAWMLIKNRRAIAAALLVLVMLAVALNASPEAVYPLIVGVLVLGLSWNAPERMGRVLGLFAAMLVLLAPLLAGLFKVLPALPAIESVARWWDVASADVLHLITGRGFDAASAARNARILPADLRFGLISDIWYDLGLLGAIGVAAMLFFSMRAAGRFGLEVGPAALAAIASATTFAVLERGATQTWWLNGMGVLAIVMLSVERGRYRTVRPRASLKHARRKEDVVMLPDPEKA